MSSAAAPLHVLRARVRGVGGDALRVQLAVRRLMAKADPDRVIGPAAILIARRARLDLRDPRRGPADPSVDRVVHRLAGGAARPIRSFVPADADAVLFADQAELLVCLARAFLSGELAHEWWWQGILAGSRDAGAVIKAWLARPHAIAPALDRLDRAGEAAAFVRRIGAHAATRLALALIDTHALPSPLRAAVDRHAGMGAPARRAAPGGELRRLGAMPPWRELGLAPASLALPASLQLPIGLAVSLSHAPVAARSEHFAQLVAEWLEQGEGEPSADGPASGRAAGSVDAAAASDPPAEPALRQSPPDAADARGGGEVPAASRNVTEAPALRSEVDAPALLRAHRPAEVEQPRAAGSTTPAPTTSANVLIRAAAIEGCAFETRFGGVVFLLNVALALELWGDFAAPADARCTVSPWLWLAAMGERLCGRGLHRDPLWDLLRELAGEDGGSYFAEPGVRDARPGDHDWRIPASWLRPFGAAAALRMVAGGGRARIEHPAGFPLVDIAGGAESLGSELAALLHDGVLPDGASGSAAEMTRRVAAMPVRRREAARARRGGIVLDAHARYLRARLCVAFGARFRDIRRLLLAREARVVASAARLDVTFALAAHPVEIRAAGLDRDPGWMPAAGRDIRLHFR